MHPAASRFFFVRRWRHAVGFRAKVPWTLPHDSARSHRWMEMCRWLLRAQSGLGSRLVHVSAGLVTQDPARPML